MDGALGIIWNGEQENIDDDILTNGLYDRLLSADNTLFNQKASDRWFDLRNSGVLGENQLRNRFAQAYDFLLSNANYEREVLKWGEAAIDLSNLSYTYEWLGNRLDFLDIYFGSTIINAENSLNTTEPLKLFPNPVRSTFRVNVPKESFFYYFYDTNGRLLQKGALFADQFIDIHHFPSGLYFLEIVTDSGYPFDYIKVVKQ